MAELAVGDYVEVLPIDCCGCIVEIVDDQFRVRIHALVARLWSKQSIRFISRKTEATPQPPKTVAGEDDVERVARGEPLSVDDIALMYGRKPYVAPLLAEITRLRAALATAGVKEGYALVPRDDDGRSVADSILPREMILAGETVIDQADMDMRNYVSGETTDWDSGMIAVAVYRAMLATSPTQPPAALGTE